MTPTDTDTETGESRAASGRVGKAAESVRRSAGDAYESAREKTSNLYGSARERAEAAYGSTREAADRARRRAADALDSNPMSVVFGGLALGAIAASVLPRTRREAEMLGPIGGKINERAKGAARAAREAGRDKLEELGLTPEAAKQKLSDAASSAGEAMRSSASAAAKAAKRKD